MAIKLQLDQYMIDFNKAALRRELRIIGREVKQKTIALIQSSTVSKPGAPPVSRSGLLASSITYRVKGNTVLIKDGAYYALFLLGAKGVGKSRKGVIEPRPYLNKILSDMSDEIMERITKAVMEGITSK